MASRSWLAAALLASLLLANGTQSSTTTAAAAGAEDGSGSGIPTTPATPTPTPSTSSTTTTEEATSGDPGINIDAVCLGSPCDAATQVCRVSTNLSACLPDDRTSCLACVPSGGQTELTLRFFPLRVAYMAPVLDVQLIQEVATKFGVNLRDLLVSTEVLDGQLVARLAIFNGNALPRSPALPLLIAEAYRGRTLDLAYTELRSGSRYPLTPAAADVEVADVTPGAEVSTEEPKTTETMASTTEDASTEAASSSSSSSSSDGLFFNDPAAVCRIRTPCLTNEVCAIQPDCQPDVSTLCDACFSRAERTRITLAFDANYEIVSGDVNAQRFRDALGLDLAQLYRFDVAHITAIILSEGSIVAEVLVDNAAYDEAPALLSALESDWLRGFIFSSPFGAMSGIPGSFQTGQESAATRASSSNNTRFYIAAGVVAGIAVLLLAVIVALYCVRKSGHHNVNNYEGDEMDLSDILGATGQVPELPTYDDAMAEESPTVMTGPRVYGDEPEPEGDFKFCAMSPELTHSSVV